MRGARLFVSAHNLKNLPTTFLFEGILHKLSFGTVFISRMFGRRVAGPAPRGGQGAFPSPIDMLGPPINKLSLLKTAAFVLNSNFGPPDKLLALLSRLLWRRLCRVVFFFKLLVHFVPVQPRLIWIVCF